MAVEIGIQYSGTPISFISHLPTLFTNPDEKIKLTASTLPINSVARLPSKYENTNPHTMPSGIPLIKKQRILNGAGTKGKINKPIAEKEIKPIMPVAR